MSEILGSTVGKELTGQSHFLDVGREFAPVARAETLRPFTPLAPHLFVYVAVAVDFAVLMCASMAAYAGPFSASFPLNDMTRIGAIGLSALWLLVIAKLHRVEFVGNYRRFLRAFVPAWCLLLVVAIACDFVLEAMGAAHGAHPAFGAQLTELVVFLAICGVVLAISRYGLAALFRYCVRQALVAHDVVILGATDLAAQFISRAAADQLGVRVRAIFDDPGTGDRSGEGIGKVTQREIAGVAVSGGIDDLLEFNRRNNITDVVIALPFDDDDRVQDLVRQLSAQPLKISMLPGPLAGALPRGWTAQADELPGIRLMPLVHLPIDFHGRLIKTAFDRSVALFALLLFAPVMVACVIGIKLMSPGSIFYRQRRVGYRNVEFTVLKFRSMHQSACDTGKLTVRDDPRVYGFGLFMRKFSLDELPQLFNVLFGDMSLVGPRPHMPDARAGGQLYSEAVPEYAARHRVKPGITGWAQVSGWRGPTETLYQIEQRVMHDLHYIENWSIWLDIKILAKTCLVGFFGKNAF